MEKSRTGLAREFALHRCPAHLVDQHLVGISKEPVLRERLVPEDLFEIVQRCFRRKLDRHGCGEIQERCQRLGLSLSQVVIMRLRLRVGVPDRNEG